MTKQMLFTSTGDAQTPSTLSITLAECVENVGIGLVPTKLAQALLPPDFQLANEGRPVTPLVVVAIKGNSFVVARQNPNAGAFVQVGLIIAPPDGTGDINVFMLSHYTTDVKMAHAFQNFGLASQYVPMLDYVVTLGDHGGRSLITVPRPAQPTLSLAGSITLPTVPSEGTFVATWWSKVNKGLLKMQTTLPTGISGDADLTLKTDSASSLGQLIGGDTMTFPILQRFNKFRRATMEVSLLPHHSLVAQGQVREGIQ